MVARSVSNQDATLVGVEEGVYVQEVLRTLNPSMPARERLILGGLGITGEAGEVADAIKKVVYLGHPLDALHVREELGDVLWYMTLLCNTLGFTLEEVAAFNVAKLHSRYPDGFSTERSLNRALNP